MQVDVLWISLAAGTAIVAIIAANWRCFGGTTLAAPAGWAVAAVVALASAEAWLAWRGPQGASLVRYAAACGTLCPLMAVLGAKRPQDRGWQWIVVSLWAVLLVPLFQSLAIGSRNSLALQPVWQGVAWCLLAMGLLNYLPTRNVAAAVLAVCGQWLLLAEQLGGDGVSDPPRRVALALCLMLAGGMLAAGAARKRAANRKSSGLNDANRRWNRFRDGWGAFWALRVMQRLNQSAELGVAPLRLQWSGWEATKVSAAENSSAAEAADQRANKIMDAVLWRFERR
jgi:hypothetical protein